MPNVKRVLVILIALFFSPLAAAVTLTGTVTNADGAPVAEAQVWVCQEAGVQRAQTDAQGAFAFLDTHPAPADVVVLKEGLALGGATVPVPGVAPLTIALAEATSVSIRVKSPAFETVEGARLRSMVINDALYLPLMVLEEHGFPLPRSADDGTLTIDNLPTKGHLSLVLSHRRYANTTVAYMPIDTQQRTILLYPGVTVRGRVTADSHGVGGAVVSMVQLGTSARQAPATTLTDPEGFYHMIVKDGEHTLTVRHPDYAPAQPQRFSTSEQEEESVANVTLPIAHTIEGSVTYPDGNHAVGVPVAYWVDDEVYDRVLTQHDGTFTFRVPDMPGSIRIVPPEGYMTAAANNIPITGKLKPEITLSPTELIPLPAVEGTVTDAEGAPLANVVVASMGIEPPLWAITDPEGRFKIQLTQVPPDEKASFRAEHPERFLRKDFQVMFPEPEPQAVSLAPYEPDIGMRPVHSDQNDLTSSVGRPADEIECNQWFNSEPLTLKSLRGNVVVLAFWAGFDQRPEAVNTIRELNVLYNVLHDADDVVFVGIHDAGSEFDDIAQAVSQYAIMFPMGIDHVEFKTFQAYDVRYIPQVVLIDKRGNVRHFQTAGRLLELIKSLRRESAAR